jgi:hypothetical protein
MLDVGEPAAPVMTSPAASSPPSPPPAAEPAVAEPFMTETMADLYLRQGHREKALEVYRAVLAQRPDDAALRARVAALEADGAPRVAAAQESAHRGPTIREVLGSIASRRPGYRVPAAASNGSPAPASDVAPQSPAGDAFSSLMAGGRPASSDESAAIVLATAFASLNGDGPGTEGGRAPAELQGHPARPAAGDLSLNTVFSGAGATGGTATGSDASLNQYFSQRALGESRSGGEGRGARNESPEEVAKFTQWLEGLKRR